MSLRQQTPCVHTHNFGPSKCRKECLDLRFRLVAPLDAIQCQNTVHSPYLLRVEGALDSSEATFIHPHSLLFIFHLKIPCGIKKRRWCLKLNNGYVSTDHVNEVAARLDCEHHAGLQDSCCAQISQSRQRDSWRVVLQVAPYIVYVFAHQVPQPMRLEHCSQVSLQSNHKIVCTLNNNHQFTF